MQTGAPRSCKRPAAEAALENIRRIREEAQKNTAVQTVNSNNNATNGVTNVNEDIQHFHATLDNVESIIETLTCIKNRVDYVEALYLSVDSTLEDEIMSNPTPVNSELKEQKARDSLATKSTRFKRLVTSKAASIGRCLKIYYVLLSLTSEGYEPSKKNSVLINRWLSKISADIPGGSSNTIQTKVLKAVTLLAASANKILGMHETSLLKFKENMNKKATNPKPKSKLTKEQRNKKKEELIDLTASPEQVVQQEAGVDDLARQIAALSTQYTDPMDLLLEELEILNIKRNAMQNAGRRRTNQRQPARTQRKPRKRT